MGLYPAKIMVAPSWHTLTTCALVRGLAESPVVQARALGMIALPGPTPTPELPLDSFSAVHISATLSLVVDDIVTHSPTALLSEAISGFGKSIVAASRRDVAQARPVEASGGQRRPKSQPGPKVPGSKSHDHHFAMLLRTNCIPSPPYLSQVFVFCYSAFLFQTFEGAISKSGVILIVGSRHIPYFRAAMAGLR